MPVQDHIETIAEDLRDPEFAFEYLQLGWDDGMPTFLVSLRNVVTATVGMTKMAEATGMSRESLYKTLSPTGNPQLSTIRKIMSVLGFDLAPRGHLATLRAEAADEAARLPVAV